MNDEFLGDYRRQPRHEFSNRLYHRLHRREQIQSTVQRGAVLAAFFCLIGILAIGVLPGARAAALEAIQEIGGIRLVESTDYTGDEGDVEIVPTTWVSLDTARETFPAPIQLPAWVPEGYILRPEIELIDFSPDQSQSSVMMAQARWEQHVGDAFTSFSLTIHIPQEAVQDFGFLVGPNVSEPVEINGQPAALVRGGWNYDAKQYDPGQGLTLHWEYQPGVYYSLMTPGDLPAETLLEIARSIP